MACAGVGQAGVPKPCLGPAVTLAPRGVRGEFTEHESLF